MSDLKLGVPIALALLLAAPAAAQETAPPDLQRVFVLSNTGDEIQGHLLQLGTGVATILVNGTRRDFPLESILRIETRGDSIRNGALIGAAIGVVAGLLSAQEVGGGAAVPFAVASAGVWSLMGAGVDAMIPGRTVIYRRPRTAAVAAGTPGAAMTVRIRF